MPGCAILRIESDLSSQDLITLPDNLDELNFNHYLKENFKLLGVQDFIADLTQHVPARGMRTIRYYGLYSSRSRATWPQWQHVVAHATDGWSQDAGLSQRGANSHL